MKPRALVLWFPGTNCHHEMMQAFEKAGARAELALLNVLQQGKQKITDADLIGIPGGFSFGDHFGAGRVAAFELVSRFREQLLDVRLKKIPIIGVCNGFQILAATGLLPGSGEIDEPIAILDLNLSARFEHWGNTRMVLHEPVGVECVWTSGMDGLPMRLPVAHGEGRLVGGKDSAHWKVVGTYGTDEGTADYPASPNGSPIAGICDASGTIAGFMPHPERRIDDLHGGSLGLLIFQAGVAAVS